jgi:hypothetical protein
MSFRGRIYHFEVQGSITPKKKIDAEKLFGSSGFAVEFASTPDQGGTH